MASINILLNKAAVASSYVSPFSANRANNGTIDTPSRWLSKITTSAAWIAIDAGAVCYVNRWVARFMGVAGWSASYNMPNYTLQSSMDGNNWTSRDVVNGNTNSITDRTVATFSARYFRMVFNSGPAINPQLASVVEFEVYSAPVLTALAISSGTLTPVFAQGTNAYTATVANSVSSITVTPTAGNYFSAITVNGATVASGSASAALPLNVGANTITVNVTDGTIVNTYIITVTRQQGVVLSGLTAQSGTTNIPLSPSFASATYAYTASVACEISSVTVTPTAGQTGSTITVNNVAVNSGSSSGPISLSIGDNDITVVVSANGISQTYTIKITRAHSAYLSNLTTQAGSTAIALNPAPFAKTTTGYTASVGFDVNSITVTPTAEDSSASITVNGSPVTSGQSSASISLAVGTTIIPVVVTADGVTQNYSITITRVDTSLSNLLLKGMPGNTAMILSPSFQATIFVYTATTGKSQVSFTPTATAAGSSITVGGTLVNSGSSITKTMSSGDNVILIVVTNGGASTTYKVTVTK
ncbi:cadherin-like beta sandwich domain-containing protein [Paludibacter sp.]|uniref:cadherin-like beta sandwich domain-containing protein n=1 Tax=Paludibacter sp. TaxID=1898105 RepID=UPI001354C3B5|nr:cadherin-like beta sandwich domain-containing protein [Paludibacter sp.]MTK53596.1 hypothetical protein [Paludibacter sp.]